MPSTKTTTKANRTDTAPPNDRTARTDSVNQVILIGRLAATPEMRHTASGKSVTTARVATNGRTLNLPGKVGDSWVRFIGVIMTSLT